MRATAARLFSALAVWLVALPAAAQVADSARASTPFVSEAALLGRSVAHTAMAPVRWREPQLRTFATAAVGLFALSALDESGRAFMRRNESARAEAVATEIERLGTVENFYILGTFFLAGVAFDDVKARSVAAEGVASSLIAGGVITPALQKLVGRSRPRRGQASHTFEPMSGNISFPSGHTTHAFAVASVIATEYDHPAVQIVSYGLAAGVAASRMYHRAHFLSDVAAAALIGTAVGRSVAHYGQRYRGELTVRPLLEVNGESGVTLGFRLTH